MNKLGFFVIRENFCTVFYETVNCLDMCLRMKVR